MKTSTAIIIAILLLAGIFSLQEQKKEQYELFFFLMNLVAAISFLINKNYLVSLFIALVNLIYLPSVYKNTKATYVYFKKLKEKIKQDKEKVKE